MTVSSQSRRVVLAHPVFARFSDGYFRAGETGQGPVFVVQLDTREASLPVAAMMREFAISADDPDGRMLALVTHALDFVPALLVGDRLPSEVLTGEASWTVEDTHHDQARARLVAQPGAAAALADPRMSGDAAADGLEILAAEYAYIEALREGFLEDARRMERAVVRLAHDVSGETTQREMLAQVRRLMAKAVPDIAQRIAAADGVVADLAVALGDLDAARAALRRHRDDLHRRWRA